jgi:hypothetical protein
VNSSLLLKDLVHNRWTANNYYAGNAHLLVMMSLALDPEDDGGSGCDQNSINSTEGLAYGVSFGYLMEGPLDLHSAGQDASLNEKYVYTFDDATNLYNSNIGKMTRSQTDIKHVGRSLLYLKPDIIIVYDRAESKTAGRFQALQPDRARNARGIWAYCVDNLSERAKAVFSVRCCRFLLPSPPARWTQLQRKCSLLQTRS